MAPSRRILLIEGHPDPSAERLNHALVTAYADGASAAGHEVRRIAVGAIDFPLLKTAEAWNHGALPPTLQPAQDGMAWLVGGNVQQSVALRMLRLDAQGRFADLPTRVAGDAPCSPDAPVHCNLNRQDWVALLKLRAGDTRTLLATTSER